MRTLRSAISATPFLVAVVAAIVVANVAGCGGEVSTAQESGESRAAAAAECPHVAPQQGTACATDATRCEYPVDFCTRTYQCKCTSDRGWICEMPTECVSR